jgi:hypothetical protein
MKRWLAALSALAFLFLCFGQEKRKQGPPELTVSEFRARRTGDGIGIFARVENTGSLPCKKPRLVVHFLSPDKGVLSTQRGPLGAAVLKPGEEVEFTLDVRAPPRAVYIRLESEDGGSRHVELRNAGPYTIDE